MKQPNRFLAPIVIAGITAGFLASAYKFIFAKSKTGSNDPDQQANSPEPLANDPIDNAP